MSGSDDFEEFIERDTERTKRIIQESVQSYRQGEGMEALKPSTGKLIEGSLWMLASFSAIGMVLVMPWVGPDGYLSGEQWLAIFLSLTALLGGGAFVVRQLAEA